MSASYPGSIKTFTNPNGTDLQSSPPHALQHENENDEINAIETELGTNPAGSKTDLKTRLAVSINDDGTLKNQVTNVSDFASVQAALDAANDDGGGIVFVPKGTHEIDTQLEIYDNISLRGEGPASIIKATESMVGMIHGSDGPGGETKDFRIRDLGWDGNGVAKNGIWVENAKNYRIFNNFMYSIGTADHDSNAMINLWGEFGIIRGNRVQNSGGQCRGILVTASPTFECLIDGNIVEDCDYGIYADDNVERLTIVNNIVKDSRKLGITTSTVKELIIANNQVTWSEASATSVGISVTGDVTNSITFNNALIANNFVDLAGSGGGANGTIDLHYIDNATVVGNIAKNGKTAAGIYLDNCLDVVVTSNRCYDDQDAQTQGKGILSAGTSDYLIVVGNNARGNVGASVDLAGANNVEANNL